MARCPRRRHELLVRTGRHGKDYRQETQQGKPPLVFLSVSASPEDGTHRSRFRTGRSLLLLRLAPKHGRSHPDSLTEADAASYYRLSASPGQRTINETTFASRPVVLHEGSVTKPNKLCVLTQRCAAPATDTTGNESRCPRCRHERIVGRFCFTILYFQ